MRRLGRLIPVVCGVHGSFQQGAVCKDWEERKETTNTVCIRSSEQTCVDAYGNRVGTWPLSPLLDVDAEDPRRTPLAIWTLPGAQAHAHVRAESATHMPTPTQTTTNSELKFNCANRSTSMETEVPV
jgi:hypothetical protein